MKDEIFNRIKEFIIKETAVDECKITEEASVEGDLGIYGDDAVDFIVTFGKKLNVDVSKFIAADYFSPEGIDIIGPIKRLFIKDKTREKKELRVYHLKKALVAGRLDEEIINGG